MLLLRCSTSTELLCHRYSELVGDNRRKFAVYCGLSCHQSLRESVWSKRCRTCKLLNGSGDCRRFRCCDWQQLDAEKSSTRWKLEYCNCIDKGRVEKIDFWYWGHKENTVGTRKSSNLKLNKPNVSFSFSDHMFVNSKSHYYKMFDTKKHGGKVGTIRETLL